MQYKNYTDPIINNYRRNEKGVKQSKRIDSEVHKIVNSKVALSEIPDEEQVLKIEGYDETKVKETVLGDKQFRVDYTNGFIYFSPSQDGATVDVSYFGLGVTYFPASRVWLEVDGENNVEKTLADVQGDIAEAKKLSASQEQLKKDIDEQGGKLKEIIDEVQKVDLTEIEKTAKDAKQAEDSLKSATSEAEAKIANINETKKQLDTSIQSAKDEGQSLSDKIEQSKVNKAEIDGACEKLKQATNSVDGSVKKAQEAVSTIDEKVNTGNQIKDELDKSTQQANEASSSLSKTKQEANQANSELIASQKTADKTKTDLEALKSESTSLSSDLDDKNKQAKENIEGLKSQNQQAKEQVANLQSEGLVAVEKKDSLSSENTKANQTINQIEGLIQSSTDLKQKLEEIIASGDLGKYVTDPKLQNILTAYATKDDLSKVDVTSQLVEYAKKSEVPTSLSQLKEDDKHQLVTNEEKRISALIGSNHVSLSVYDFETLLFNLYYLMLEFPNLEMAPFFDFVLGWIPKDKELAKDVKNVEGYNKFCLSGLFQKEMQEGTQKHEAFKDFLILKYSGEPFTPEELGELLSNPSTDNEYRCWVYKGVYDELSSKYISKWTFDFSKGYFVEQQKDKHLSSNDYTNEDKAKVNNIPTSLSQLTDDETHRLVTDEEKNKWNNPPNPDLSGYAKLKDILASKVIDIYELDKDFWDAFHNDNKLKKAIQRDMLTLVSFKGSNSYDLMTKAGFETALLYKGQLVGCTPLSLGNNIDENFTKTNKFNQDSLLYISSRDMYQYNAAIQNQLKELTTTTSTIPKSLSQLTNDTKFKTESEIQEMITKENSMTVEVVDSLPTTGKDKTIYLVKDSKGSGDNNHLEYLWVKSKWELVGSTQVDLSGYAKKEDLPTLEEKEKLKQLPYVGELHEKLDKKLDKADKAEMNGRENWQDDKSYTTPKFVANAVGTLSGEMLQGINDSLQEELDKKVDKVDGKTLSTNDFTNDYKNTIDTIKNTALAITSNSSDLNTLTKAGFYSCRGCSNRPANGHSYATLIVSKADTTTDGSQTDTVQFYLDMDNNAFIRNSIDKSGTWTDWVQLGGHATKVLTESEYNGLSNKDANTLYFIK